MAVLGVLPFRPFGPTGLDAVAAGMGLTGKVVSWRCRGGAGKRAPAALRATYDRTSSVVKLGITSPLPLFPCSSCCALCMRLRAVLVTPRRFRLLAATSFWNGNIDSQVKF